jgi:hypothetical protein
MLEDFSGSMTRDYFYLIRFQLSILKSESPENQEPVVYYYSPIGETIRVDYIWYDKAKDMLIVQGEDESNQLCQTVSRAPGVNLMIKLEDTDSKHAKGSSVGFRVVENEER